MSQADLLAPPDARAVARAIDSYTAALRGRYGDHLRGVYLFGSRARGDFQPFSDVDVALVFDSEEDVMQIRPLSDLAYDVFLETGAEIQPWPFLQAEWENPARSTSPALVRSARRDARRVFAP